MVVAQNAVVREWIAKAGIIDAQENGQVGKGRGEKPLRIGPSFFAKSGESAMHAATDQLIGGS